MRPDASTGGHVTGAPCGRCARGPTHAAPSVGEGRGRGGGRGAGGKSGGGKVGRGPPVGGGRVEPHGRVPRVSRAPIDNAVGWLLVYELEGFSELELCNYGVQFLGCNLIQSWKDFEYFSYCNNLANFYFKRSLFRV